MAVRFKLRDSYSNDAANMLKLAEVIERDSEVSLPNKREVIALLQDLTGKLLKLKDSAMARKAAR